MSIEVLSPETASTQRPRVRHQAREAVVLMFFSAATSVGVATALLLLSRLPAGN